MSDFLDRLGRRSFGTLEVVRPRVPALYEPDRRREGLVTRPSAPVSRDEPEADADRVQETSAAETAGPRPTRSVARGRETPAIPAASGTTWTSLDEGEALQTPTGTQPVPTAPMQSQAAPPTEQLPRRLAPARQIGNPAANSEQFPTPVPADAPTVGEASATLGRTMSPRDRRAADRPIETAQAEARQIPAPVRLASAPQTNQSAGHSAASHSQPDIRITVGRVDVRAIFPEAPVRRAPPARTRPTVSLDDYLKRSPRGS